MKAELATDTIPCGLVMNVSLLPLMGLWCLAFWHYGCMAFVSFGDLAYNLGSRIPGIGTGVRNYLWRLCM